MANGFYLFPKIERNLKRILIVDSEYPPKCAAGSDAIGGIPTILWAAPALESALASAGDCWHGGHVPWLYMLGGISVIVVGQLVIWPSLVHSGLQCNHSGLEPLPKSPMKTRTKLGSEGHFLMPWKTKTGDLVADFEEDWTSAHRILALFCKNRVILRREARPFPWPESGNRQLWLSMQERRCL